MKNISLDFDGVIHAYTSPWTAATEITDGPVDGAFDFIRGAFERGYHVHIHTARANDAGVELAIVQWFLKHGLDHIYTDRMTISSLKKGAVIYIDDRGWRFEGHFPSFEAIEKLQQWNKKLPLPSVPSATSVGSIPMGGRPHIVNGEFQSDKYPTCPPGKVPLSVKDTTAQDLLWEYAQRRRAVDPEFASDLEFALIGAGYDPPNTERLHDRLVAGRLPDPEKAAQQSLDRIEAIRRGE